MIVVWSRAPPREGTDHATVLESLPIGKDLGQEQLCRAARARAAAEPVGRPAEALGLVGPQSSAGALARTRHQLRGQVFQVPGTAGLDLDHEQNALGLGHQVELPFGGAYPTAQNIRAPAAQMSGGEGFSRLTQEGVSPGIQARS